MRNRYCRPNLNTGGRLIRGAAGLLLAAGTVALWTHLPWLAVLCGVSAAFVLFEALRGWCALRACGIKTRF